MKASVLVILTCTGLTLPAQVGAPTESQRGNDTAGHKSLPEKLHKIHSNELEAGLNDDLIRLRQNQADSLKRLEDSLKKNPQ